MGAVFINYRRDETAGEARALYKDLVASLGSESVFMDVDNIDLGRDFREALQKRLESCEMMLALIGAGWLDAQGPSGQRRLDDPDDFVRQEIAAALQRNIPVTPVLLQGAQMPSAKQLPEELEGFAYRNGFELRHQRWESDVQEMITRLGLGSDEAAVAESGPSDAPEPKKRSWLPVAGAAAVAATVVVVGLLYFGVATSPAPESPKAEVIAGITLPAYVILDSAFKEKKQAQRRLVDLDRAGYSNTGFFWIPDFEYLSGTELFQVYVGPFGKKEKAEAAICRYNGKMGTPTYGVRLATQGREEFRCPGS